jgi:hypothetical protein
MSTTPTVFSALLAEQHVADLHRAARAARPRGSEADTPPAPSATPGTASSWTPFAFVVRHWPLRPSH